MKNTLVILTPMQEEHEVLHHIVDDLGYKAADIEKLRNEKKLFIQKTGMGAINITNCIYNSQHFFENDNIDIILCGFAGALSHELKIGQSCQISNVTHFSFITHQGAGDFEIINVATKEHDSLLSAEHDKLKLPSISLSPAKIDNEKCYNLISVPALLQLQPTKEYLLNSGVEVVDMEGYGLAVALYHLRTAHKNLAKTINLNIVKTITDSPDEKFEFTKLAEYKEQLRSCTLLNQIIGKKLAEI